MIWERHNNDHNDNVKDTVLKYGKLRFVIPNEGEHFWPYYGILYAGEYDEILKNTDRSSVILDAGAHVGFFSIPASINSKCVISIEPAKLHYMYLLKNITLNKTKNIFTANCAISNRKGIAYMKQNGIASRVSLNGEIVRTCTISDILNITSKIDFVKMDIEGCEGSVIDSLPLKSIKTIIVETHNKDNERKVIETLENESFDVYYWKPSYKKILKRIIKNFDDIIHSELKLKAPLLKLIVKKSLKGRNIFLQLEDSTNIKIIVGVR